MIKFRNEIYEGVSICPLTCRVFNDKTGKIYSQKIKKGRMLSYIPFPVSAWFPTHHLIAYTFLNLEYGKDYVVHHKDENKLNNIPSNLIIMKSKDHDSYHANTMSEEHKKRISISTKGRKPWNKGLKMSDEFCEKNKQTQLKYRSMHPFTEEWRAHVSQGVKNAYERKKLNNKKINDGEN